MKQKILISHLLVEVPENTDISASVDELSLATIMANLAYYGYAPSLEVFEKIKNLKLKQITALWQKLEIGLKEITGANRQMEDFVVYKNFPKEVLDMNQAHYWFNQILMYIGAPKNWFTQSEEDRGQLNEKLKLKVLQLASSQSLDEIYVNLKNNSARWSDQQKEEVLYLVKHLEIKSINLDEFNFKENGVLLIKNVFDSGINFQISNATDVLRLAAALSDGDISLREKIKFVHFKRPVRKVLLTLLENSKNLIEDMGLRPEPFKRLLQNLHPGDYNLKKVSMAYDQLYKGEYQTFNSEVEFKIQQKDISVLALLANKPGDFYRKLHQLVNLFGNNVIQAFSQIVPKLKTIQLLRMDSYILTINNRQGLIYPPNGNWTKAQFVVNNKKPLEAEIATNLHGCIALELKKRMAVAFPEGVALDLNTSDIKLQTNDQKLAAYGRGTVFPIPKNVNFIRSASYWKTSGYGHNTWFDNGWNFFDAHWANVETCCWNSHKIVNDAAIFSGDPTNMHDLEGRACQMIDLYIDKLINNGIRYAVWNILCYSHIPFSDAEEVLATLQWGENAEEGKLYEPSRAQMVFPLHGDNLTKYVAYIDLVERKLVYMDANLHGNIYSAVTNGASLAAKMPAFIEYLKTLPSVADLFIHAPQGKLPVLYTDENINLEKGISAYIFRPCNPENQFKQLNLEQFLS